MGWRIVGILVLTVVLAAGVAAWIRRYDFTPTVNGIVLVDHWRQTAQACSVQTYGQLSVTCGAPELLNFHDQAEAARAILLRLGNE